MNEMMNGLSTGIIDLFFHIESHNHYKNSSLSHECFLSFVLIIIMINMRLDYKYNWTLEKFYRELQQAMSVWECNDV